MTGAVREPVALPVGVCDTVMDAESLIEAVSLAELEDEPLDEPDPVADAEGEDEDEGVPLRVPLREASDDRVLVCVVGPLGVPEGVAAEEPVPDPLREGEGVALADARYDREVDAVPLDDGLAVPVPLADGELDALPVPLADRVAAAEKLGVPLGVGRALLEDVGVTDPVHELVALRDVDAPKLSEDVLLPVEEGVSVPEPEGLEVTAGVGVGVPLPDPLPLEEEEKLPELVAEAVAECDMDAPSDNVELLLMDREGVPDAVPLEDRLPVRLAE